MVDACLVLQETNHIIHAHHRVMLFFYILNSIGAIATFHFSCLKVVALHALIFIFLLAFSVLICQLHALANEMPINVICLLYNWTVYYGCLRSLSIFDVLVFGLVPGILVLSILYLSEIIWSFIEQNCLNSVAPHLSKICRLYFWYQN